MQIEIVQLTTEELVNELASASAGKDKGTKISLKKWMRAEHSPIRGLLFKVVLKDIPTFVSVHLARHKIGVEHIVESNREDLQVKYNKEVKKADRDTLVTHKMKINAQALITMARKRLCLNAHKRTVNTMIAITKEMRKVNPTLADFMVVECVYRNGLCPEMKCCGFNNSTGFKKQMDKYAENFNGNIGYAIRKDDSATRGKCDTAMELLSGESSKGNAEGGISQESGD